MTRAEARRRAVAAAESAFTDHINQHPEGLFPEGPALRVAIAAYERAMADAGWRMVRVGERMPWPNYEEYAERTAGWNACRAAMLEDGE